MLYVLIQRMAMVRTVLPCMIVVSGWLVRLQSEETSEADHFSA